MFLAWIGITRGTPWRPGQRDENSRVSPVTVPTSCMNTRSTCSGRNVITTEAAGCRASSRPCDTDIPVETSLRLSIESGSVEMAGLTGWRRVQLRFDVLTKTGSRS